MLASIFKIQFTFRISYNNSLVCTRTCCQTIGVIASCQKFLNGGSLSFRTSCRYPSMTKNFAFRFRTYRTCLSRCTRCSYPLMAIRFTFRCGTYRTGLRFRTRCVYPSMTKGLNCLFFRCATFADTRFYAFFYTRRCLRSQI